jgi:hypothetical protein
MSTKHLHPHPSFFKVYKELEKQNKKVEAALQEAVKQLNKAHGAYRLLTSYAEEIVHYALAARDNAEADLVLARKTTKELKK